jgi:hypothetical protein
VDFICYSICCNYPSVKEFETFASSAVATPVKEVEPVKSSSVATIAKETPAVVGGELAEYAQCGGRTFKATGSCASGLTYQK